MKKGIHLITAGGQPKKNKQIIEGKEIMQLHTKQREVAQSPARFKVLRAGRRSGKTAFNIEDCCFRAVRKKDQNILYVSPNQKQSRSIVWEDLKKRLYPIGATFNEQRLEIKVPTAEAGTSTIFVGGWETRESYRGMRFHHVVFDELDTLRDFFVSWQEIFRPALTDTAGSATFIGTPKSDSRNLQRLEKFAENDSDYRTFHFTSYDNPHVSDIEIDKAKAELAYDTFKQEYMAEYVENQGALFNYSALVDVFSNSIDRGTSKYLIIDIAGDGSDRTVFSYWEGLVEYKRVGYERLNSESIKMKIREEAQSHKIPFSHVLVDAIGVGEHLPHDPLLDGIVGFKSSFAAIKTDHSIVALPNVHYTKEAPLTSDYKNLRSQCIFTLADLVNNHKIASEVEGQAKEVILQELPLYTDDSKGDGKRFATPKEEIKKRLGRSPDDSDCLIMRMFFVLTERLSPMQSEERIERAKKTAQQFLQGHSMSEFNSNK